jgi:hypothetical protein
MTEQELVQGFCDLLNIDLLEFKCSYGTKIGIAVEPDDYSYDFSVGIQYITKTSTVFFVSASPRTERLLKASGIPYQDYTLNLSRFLVVI